MPEDPLNPDECELETALSALVPTAPGLSHDELLYAAGVREARRHSRRRLPLWLAAAAVLSGVSGLIGAALSGAASPPQNAVADSGADSRPPKAAAARTDPASVPEVPKSHDGPRIEHSFSRIGNVDSWSIERLQKYGIRIAPCAQWCDMTDPPKEWMTVRFDCSRLPSDFEVYMYAQLISGERDADSSSTSLRSIRGVPDKDSVSLEFAVSKEVSLRRSHLSIVIWPPGTEEGREASGYSLSLNRIVELSRQKPADSGF